ncbi:MAG: hypothetical protein LBR75_05730 [Prevotellaceae bacterium]|jgi:hypothetical protein|nr:hypothetical protein [Prevotellaceae bacterium]
MYKLTIPRGIAEFTEYIKNAYDKVNSKLTNYKIDAEAFKPVTSVYNDYIAAEAKAADPEYATRGNRDDRNLLRQELEKVWRVFLGANIRYNTRVSVADMAVIGFTPSAGGTPTPVPATEPVVKVDFSKEQQHTIHFSDGELSGRAKPDGVHGAEIWAKTGGEAPMDDSEFRFLAVDTASPYSQRFDLNERGEKAYYRLRWVNTRGETGPWSAVVSAVIG